MSPTSTLKNRHRSRGSRPAHGAAMGLPLCADLARDPVARRKLLQQVDDLSLDRDVEGRHRFVGDDQLGAHGEGAGDADALTLAPGELMRVAPEVLGGEAHRLEQLYDALLALATASGELVDDE